MRYDQWEEQYQPAKNHLNADASFDGCMFETFGAEVAYVQDQSDAHIWTLVDDGEGGECIVSGFYFVNRLGYFITKKARPEGAEIEVKISYFITKKARPEGAEIEVKIT